MRSLLQFRHSGTLRNLKKVEQALELLNKVLMAAMVVMMVMMTTMVMVMVMVTAMVVVIMVIKEKKSTVSIMHQVVDLEEGGEESHE